MTEGEVNYSNVIIATRCDNINPKIQNQAAQIGTSERLRRQVLTYRSGVSLRRVLGWPLLGEASLFIVLTISGVWLAAFYRPTATEPVPRAGPYFSLKHLPG
jgi:hypothetical protein